MALGEIALIRPDDFLRDALKFVPGIIEEEVGEDDEDKMEIDNKGAGRGREVDTLAACVQCLVQCLNPETAGSGQGECNPIPFPRRRRTRFCFIWLSFTNASTPSVRSPAKPNHSAGR